MNTTIKDLKKNDQFKFNDEIYTVRRKWINDDKPLIAYDKYNSRINFFWEGLDVEKIVIP